MSKVKLNQIAHARSGDKGSNANIGVIAFSKQGYEYLGKVLTEQTVSGFFRQMRPSRVERFELPVINAYNFLLQDVLDGGASRSLRIDSQGKTLATMLLELEIDAPDELESMLRAD